MKPEQLLQPSDSFAFRHIGPRDDEIEQMLATLGHRALGDLVDETIPASIRYDKALDLPPPVGEHAAVAELRRIFDLNEVHRTFIGQGYHACITPPVIVRSILENPGWYTQYTPYQPEIAQGRLEALVIFQTMVSDLTGMDLANASLLDEATAAAEAMTMCRAIGRGKRRGFYASQDCHPATLAVLRTRAEPLGIRLHVGPIEAADFEAQDLFGILIQSPNTEGRLVDFRAVAEGAHDARALAVVATDLLASVLMTPAGEWGADIVVGSSQRFGVPLGFGGPHAGFLATHARFKRQVPGRIIGVSRDRHGHVAYRLALQTREQHIRRERATSNICTAQVLLAVMAGMYATYHGPAGLRRIAQRVHGLAALFAGGLGRLGYEVGAAPFFDTLRVPVGSPERKAEIIEAGRARRINLRIYDDDSLGVALGEDTSMADVADLLAIFAGKSQAVPDVEALAREVDLDLDPSLVRRSAYLTHPFFNRYHSEHELLRYLQRLQGRDLSLATSMIPLGSCTMKLNATAEMLAVSWPEVANIHPFVPSEQSGGYAVLIDQLERWLAEITGLAAVSLQPNAGSQGEYAGLLVIRAYHAARGERERDVCLIPVSAHGTNPASSVMAGLKVVAVECDDHGNIDMADLESKATLHAKRLAALMVTYPSTHGVFEEGIREICAVVHRAGGQVYLDGANMNAQVGLCRPGEMGADVCHLNLHKTFAIPHGGGGPGIGPIAVAAHLAPFLPGHPLASDRDHACVGPIAQAPYGSAGVLPISWAYIRMMGPEGLTRASQVAILSANYMAKRLEAAYPVLYTGTHGRVAHEFIIDLRPFRASAGIEVDDVAKRLMDYGFHAPTMSWPVAGTMMIEPTESESKAEVDRFCDAMLAIREEIRAIEAGEADRTDNLLKNAPHTAEAVSADHWPHPYGREQAAFPASWMRGRKFWPAVGRVDNAWGDRHLMCSCPAVQAYDEG